MQKKLDFYFTKKDVSGISTERESELLDVMLPRSVQPHSVATVPMPGRRTHGKNKGGKDVHQSHGGGGTMQMYEI